LQLVGVPPHRQPHGLSDRVALGFAKLLLINIGSGFHRIGCIIEKGHINQPLQTALLNAARRSVQGVSDQYLGI
jgi:hypothetical protein